MRKVISKDGTSIAYDKVGSGSLLILVDGALCSRAFRPNAKARQIISAEFYGN